MEETYSGPFEKEIWHRVIVKRQFCVRSELKVDDGNTMTDEIRELDVRCSYGIIHFRTFPFQNFEVLGNSKIQTLT